MTITEIEKERLQHIQRIWAARDNTAIQTPAKSTSQDEYDASIKSKVSPEDFAGMVNGGMKNTVIDQSYKQGLEPLSD
jgi:hypothetical protein